MTREVLLWEIVVIIHTFGGSILLSSISGLPTINFFVVLGAILFFINLLSIFYCIKYNKQRILRVDSVTFVFFWSIVTIVILLISLFGLDLVWNVYLIKTT